MPSLFLDYSDLGPLIDALGECTDALDDFGDFELLNGHKARPEDTMEARVSARDCLREFIQFQRPTPEMSDCEASTIIAILTLATHCASALASRAGNAANADMDNMSCLNRALQALEILL